MSEIRKEIEDATYEICHIFDSVVACVQSKVSEGVNCIDTHELGEAADIIKDLAIAKEKMVKACYYTQIAEAMEEAGEEDEEEVRRFYSPNRGRRYYNGHRSGRSNMRYFDDSEYDMDADTYMSKSPKELRDMDRRMGRMYYTPMEGMDGAYGKVYESRKMLMEHKKKNPTEDASDKLDKYVGDLTEDMTEISSMLNPNEKTLFKQKLSMLASRI